MTTVNELIDLLSAARDMNGLGDAPVLVSGIRDTDARRTVVGVSTTAKTVTLTQQTHYCWRAFDGLVFDDNGTLVGSIDEVGKPRRRGHEVRLSNGTGPYEAIRHGGERLGESPTIEGALDLFSRH